MIRTLVVASFLLAAAPSERPRMTPEVWHPTLVAYTPAGEKVTEFGSGLSKAGYDKLRQALAWEPGKGRTDDYFDAWDGRRYLAKNGQMPVKVRVKRKAKGPQWQVSRFVAKDRVHVGGLSIKIHTTESWEAKLKGREAEAFLAATDAFWAKVDAGGAPLRRAGDAVDAAFDALRAHKAPPGLPCFEGTIGKAAGAYKLYPSKHTPNKQRLEGVLPGFTAAEVTLQLGREDERDPEGRPVTVYELEAEADRPLDAQRQQAAATAIGQWMAKAGIVPADLDAPGTRGWQYTTAQLLKK